jgi:Putative zinc-finger
MTDPFRYDDGAYVLGALAPDERLAFEAHLETCPECQDRVADARAAAGLLTGLTVADIRDPGPIPDTLLPGLLRSARRERSRRRWVTGSLAAVAAACITALAIVLLPASTSPSSPERAFVAVRSTPVSATAQLVSKTWGTEIDLHCHYAEQFDRYEPYRLVVVDTHGVRHDAGSWTLAPGKEISFTGGTSLREADISRIEITLDNGLPILQLRL